MEAQLPHYHLQELPFHFVVFNVLQVECVEVVLIRLDVVLNRLE